MTSEAELPPLHACPACGRDVGTLVPLRPGEFSVCSLCITALVATEGGGCRVATSEEEQDPRMRRKVETLQWLRRVFPSLRRTDG